MVSQARYNVPLMPSLIAAGVAGWFLALRRDRAAAAEPCHDAGMELGQIGIWRSRNRGSADAASAIERLGFGALWIGGSPSVDQVRPVPRGLEHDCR